jgi:hypothetical protein
VKATPVNGSPARPVKKGQMMADRMRGQDFPQLPDDRNFENGAGFLLSNPDELAGAPCESRRLGAARYARMASRSRASCSRC